MKTNKIFQFFQIFLLLSGIGCSPTVYNHGVPNLVQVKPGLWRSGQVTTTEGWQYLKSLGVTRVIKLNFDSEGSDSGAIAVGMTVQDFSIQPAGDKDIFSNITNTFVRPDIVRLNEIERAIELSGGVLVHCTHGQDRTGLVIGRHRVLFDKWAKAAAYDEMLKNHFHPSLRGLHESWEDDLKP